MHISLQKFRATAAECSRRVDDAFNRLPRAVQLPVAALAMTTLAIGLMAAQDRLDEALNPDTPSRQWGRQVAAVKDGATLICGNMRYTQETIPPHFRDVPTPENFAFWQNYTGLQCRVEDLRS